MSVARRPRGVSVVTRVALSTVMVGTAGVIALTGVSHAVADEETETTLVATAGTLTASITAAGVPVTGGSVTFMLDGVALGPTVEVHGGTASWTQPPTAGSTATSVTAAFSGPGYAVSEDTVEREIADEPVFDQETPTDAVVGTTVDVVVEPSVEDASVAVTAAPGEDPQACAVAGPTVSFGHAGTCDLVAVQAGDWETTGASAQQSIDVTTTPTLVSLTITAGQLTAVVDAEEPSVHVPQGQVQFLVNEEEAGAPVTVVNGRAVLAKTLRPGVDWEVGALYLGSDDADESEAYESRSDPFIEAEVSSRLKSRGGWYRTPVTVSFECEENTAVLRSCPAAKVISKDGAKQVVSGTTTAVDGGSATATVRVSVDRTAPTLKLTGAKNRGTVKAAKLPKLTCRAADKTSGPGGCAVAQRVLKKSGKKTTLGYTAQAKDKAGNVTKVTGTYVWVKK